jgi:hypothetical protein
MLMLCQAVQGLTRAKSWSDCYGCSVTFTDKQACAAWSYHTEPCRQAPFLTLSVSTYAVQLAWWFAHFPAHRFKVMTSADLHTIDPTPILNSIIQFSGLHAHPFNKTMLRDVWGYNGGYNITDLSAIELKTVQFLQLFYRQAELDLRALLAPLGFAGIPSEISK